MLLALPLHGPRQLFLPSVVLLCCCVSCAKTPMFPQFGNSRGWFVQNEAGKPSDGLCDCLCVQHTMASHLCNSMTYKNKPAQVPQYAYHFVPKLIQTKLGHIILTPLDMMMRHITCRVLIVSELVCMCACSAGGLIMARGLGNQNMKRYHMWNLSHQDISNKV